MSDATTRRAGVLLIVSLTCLNPSHFFFDQFLLHLTYFVILVDVILLIETIQTLVHTQE